MTTQDYAEFEQRFAAFMVSEGLRNLSTISEPYFSWTSCACCESMYGGDRYDCNGWSERDSEIKTYEGVCQDCVYYAEYGQLDDRSMLTLS
jgi:hypothetical protein